MKKNMISILILALLVVNVVLTGIMMFTVTGTMKKTSSLIDGITTALSLEVGDTAPEAQTETAEVPMKNIAIHKIEDAMTILLARGVDGEDHYCSVSVSLSMNIKDKDYKKYGETIAEKEDLIKGQIVEAIGSYTIEEAQGNEDELRKDILNRIQKMYDSQFIYNVIFTDIKFA